MRTIIYTETGGPSVLHLVDRDPIEPAAGEVRVQLAVSGVNPTDWKSRAGAARIQGLPFAEIVPNLDGAGTIDAVGADVTDLTVGDRVWVYLAAHEREHGGTAQEFTTLPVSRVVPLPDVASFELGASLGVPALTAHRALTVAEDGPQRLTPGALDGTTVLVAGGAGAVGNAAIQLARWAGATVITTVSGDAKAGLATAAGAHHVVNYRQSDAAAEIRRIAPNGVDIVVEVAGARNVELNLAVIRNRGVVAVYGSEGGGDLTLDGRHFALNVRYQFVLLYTMGQHALDAGAHDINAAIIDGALDVGEAKGLPLHRFPLERTADAHAAVQDGLAGKVLVDLV
ncbi:NADPH:quinone reductase [Glaciihabitans sp. UYNi722]|uniref:NADPH:quinone reductase n=1 Tax=Glaciihabitans sp. UYNi722 TaxID=3156344 RepID=UPI003395D98D